MAALAWMLRAWLGDVRITANDHAWGKVVKRYIENQDEGLPPIDRFNLGQKYFFWVMVFAGVVLLLSGIVLWIPETLPWSLRDLRSAAILQPKASNLRPLSPRSPAGARSSCESPAPPGLRRSERILLIAEPADEGGRADEEFPETPQRGVGHSSAGLFSQKPFNGL
jgi:hypothetical protein